MTTRTTSRGFGVYAEFRDRYNSEVRVQESSLGTERCVWIFCRNPGFTESPPAPHLTVEQARTVRDALDAFIREAEGD